MFYIKITEIIPAGYPPRYPVSEKTMVYYYRPNRLTNMFHDQTVFDEYAEALTVLNKLREDHNNYINEIQAYHSQRPKILKELEERRARTTFDICDLSDYPDHSEFSAAFPFNQDNIPDIDRDVVFIYRNGKTTGVVTNFLRKEMLKGRYLHLENKSDFVRWKYIEDSIYLKYKKQLLN